MAVVFFTLWVIMVVAAINIASKKGRSSCGFVAITLLVPFIGLIIAVAMSPDQSTMDQLALNQGAAVKCSACRSLIDPEATICPHCQTKIESFRIGSLR